MLISEVISETTGDSLAFSVEKRKVSFVQVS
jgi:hypothetical protein